MVYLSIAVLLAPLAVQSGGGHGPALSAPGRLPCGVITPE